MSDLSGTVFNQPAAEAQTAGDPGFTFVNEAARATWMTRIRNCRAQIVTLQNPEEGTPGADAKMSTAILDGQLNILEGAGQFAKRCEDLRAHEHDVMNETAFVHHIVRTALVDVMIKNPEANFQISKLREVLGGVWEYASLIDMVFQPEHNRNIQRVVATIRGEFGARPLSAG